MSVIDFLLGWDRRVRKLRKNWDRTREKSLKKKNPLRQAALQKLDLIETSLRMLEEQNLSVMDKSRIAGEVSAGIQEVKHILESEEEPVMI